MTPGSGHLSLGPERLAPDKIISAVTGWVLDKLHNSTWCGHDPRCFSLRRRKNIKTSSTVPGMAEQLETFLGEPEQVFPNTSNQLAMKSDLLGIVWLWAETRLLDFWGPAVADNVWELGEAEGFRSITIDYWTPPTPPLPWFQQIFHKLPLIINQKKIGPTRARLPSKGSFLPPPHFVCRRMKAQMFLELSSCFADAALSRAGKIWGLQVMNINRAADLLRATAPRFVYPTGDKVMFGLAGINV